jgi:murein DD-endopeptidase MepM/ murein hydrolase activator NlpD
MVDKKIICLAFIILSLPGCVSNSRYPPAPSMTAQAPVFYYGLSGGADSAGMHTVAAGETPWMIAQYYRLSMQDIIAVNNLQPPYSLQAGQRLRLPPPAIYKARPGDTLYSISHTFSVGMTQLAQLNNLRPPYAVTPGAAIRLPSVRPAPSPVAVSPPSPSPSAAAYAPPRAIVSPPSRDTQGEVERDIAGEMTRKPSASPPPIISETSPVWAGGNGRFAWPVNGPVISSYGPKPGGLHNDGVNIRSARGAPVRAAENGVVVYAGNELKGFGNLVLLRHPDRWMTAYAHMDQISVRRGQQVQRGQALGAIGSTGAVSEPQLHFEVRRGTEALNPLTYLARQGT